MENHVDKGAGGRGSKYGKGGVDILAARFVVGQRRRVVFTYIV
jgi:hypothetical protein